MADEVQVDDDIDDGEVVPPLTRTQRGTLVATGVGLFMIFLDAMIVNVALPDIEADLGGGEAGAQWTVTAYSLAMAVSMMTFAVFADRFGRRLVYVAGLGVFAAASLACGLAPALGVLDVARGVQGLAAAAVNVTSLALVSAAFDNPKAKARAIGIWSAIAAIGLALGPTLGGVLTEAFGWRSVFVVNVPIGLAAMVATWVYVAESRDPTPRSFDVAGQALYVVGIGGVAFAIIEAPQLGWTAPAILGALALFVVAMPLFVRYELRSDQPMMEVRLFTERAYRAAIIAVFVALFGAYGMLLVVDQLWQEVRNYSVLDAGFRLLPLALVQVVLSPLAGRWVARFGARRVMLTGLGILCGSFAVQIVGVWADHSITTVGVAFVGAGLALTVTTATTVAMASVPEARAGMASGIMSSQRALGSTAGYAVLGSIVAVWVGPGADLRIGIGVALGVAFVALALTTFVAFRAIPARLVEA